MPLEFDAIASLSGDGVLHEIINGLASRKDNAIKALRIPVVPIPTGSANACNLNLQGQKVSSQRGAMRDWFRLRDRELIQRWGCPSRAVLMSRWQR